MRRTLIALAALGLALGLTASPAHAAGGDPGKCLIEDAQEADIDLLALDAENDEDVEVANELFEECEVIANPILPAPAELIWGSLAFLVLAVVLIKWGVPPIRQAMADRTERIREEVEAAERIREEAAAEESAREDELKEARQEATGLVESARQEADEYRTAERERIDAEMAERREQAQADIDAAREQALSDIRGEVATLAIGAAEEVVGRNLDRSANERLVEDFIDRVGRGGNN